ncbi:MAG: 1-acyl-sn-glycerol-3-phosphate acyltransferase [Bacteroidales bacterium]|nr:1-acyl-sn-glycerol-3-phosphate acyltransferase [Bacteroidales bacterium]
MDILKSITVWFVGITLLVVFLPITFIIWLLVLPFDRNRSVVHWIQIYLSIIISYLIPIWKIKIEGRNKAIHGTTYVIISNHQSILDILLINCLRLRFKWISKIENNKVPVLGWYLKMADYITVDRGDKESKEMMLLESYKCLQKGISLMIFPEGTRSVDRQIGFFKRGAFQLAISADKPILPVLIDGTGGILPKHGLIIGGWHKIIIRVLDPVTPGSFGTNDPDKLAIKFQNMMISELDKLRNETGTR